MKTKYISAIVTNQFGEILFLRRNQNDEFEPGKWGLSGGKIEEGETPIECCRREVKEETMLDVDRFREVGYEETDNACIWYFFCPLSEYQEVVIDEEHENYLWCCLEDCPFANDLVMNTYDHLCKMMPTKQTSDLIKVPLPDQEISLTKLIELVDAYSTKQKTDLYKDISFSEIVGKNGLLISKDHLYSFQEACEIDILNSPSFIRIVTPISNTSKTFLYANRKAIEAIL